MLLGKQVRLVSPGAMIGLSILAQSVISNELHDMLKQLSLWKIVMITEIWAAYLYLQEWLGVGHVDMGV